MDDALVRNTSRALFQHGVASGDPLSDRVILWTRLSRPATVVAPDGLDVDWRIATDPAVANVVARGIVRRPRRARLHASRSMRLVCSPVATYYYAFDIGGRALADRAHEDAPRGRATACASRSMCCSNYPSGFFNVYRCDSEAARPRCNRARRRLHLRVRERQLQRRRGFQRIPEPPREAVTLSDYRSRYATYRTDPDLQEAHRQHPFIAVWDDHELANDAWSGGASTTTPNKAKATGRPAGGRLSRLSRMDADSRITGPGIQPVPEFPFRRTDRPHHARHAWPPRPAGPPRGRGPPIQDERCSAPLRKRGCSTSCARRRPRAAWRMLGQQVLFSTVTPPGGRPPHRRVGRLSDGTRSGARLHRERAHPRHRHPHRRYPQLVGARRGA